MKTNNIVRQSVRYITGFIITIGLVLLISCGGGGSGDGSIIDTGSTGKAAINEQNAVQLALGAYYYGDLVKEVVVAINTVKSRSTPVIEETENGSCGGSMTLAIDTVDIDGNFTGTLQYADYCDVGETIDGVVNLSGRVDLTSEDIVNLDTSCPQLLFQDNNLATVYKVEDYVVSVDYDANTASVVTTYKSGRYYDPDFGYVEVSSPVVFTQSTSEIGPSSGELMITGDLQTKALLVAQTPETFEVTADTDGDGTLEWSSGTQNWNTGILVP